MQTLMQPFDRPNGLYVQPSNPISSAQSIAFPLKHTEVQAKITGNLSRVEVTQCFENPFTTALEAIYIFPLPDEAAVDEMLIRVGDRTIQGSIKKRQEAQQLYEQAKQLGHTAGLLEQERDNIFTQSLANIQPGESIEVTICYTDSLKFVQATVQEGTREKIGDTVNTVNAGDTTDVAMAGNYEFVFPMVVGPRYIPGTPIDDQTPGGGSAVAPMTQNQDTDLVVDASRLNAPILPSGVRSCHDIQVTIEIDAGIAIRQVRSPSHQIQVTQKDQTVTIRLAESDTVPNKDLIIRYQVAGEETQTTVLTQSDERGGHFAVYLIPAVQYAASQIVPKDVVFLIDTSGSQMGAPLRQCQELMRCLINGLHADDTFSIIDFSDTTQQLSTVPLTNTPAHRSQAMQYIDHLHAGGGTEMLRGIRAVLNFPITDSNRLRSIVLLTDGYIGNENQVLAEVQRYLQPEVRLYSFGAGSSVNRFLLNRIAEMGRGAACIIRPDEPTDAAVATFFRQINNPVLTNIQVQWQGEGEAPIFYPSLPPDLFADQPLVLFGRKADRLAGKLQISGRAAGKQYQQTFALSFDPDGNPAIAQLWGRARIKQLMNQMVSGETKIGVEAVTDTALSYQLLSPYTAFVAVSDQIRVNPTEGAISVQVPVEMPDNISYAGIFGTVAHAAPIARMAPATLSAPMPLTAAPPGQVAPRRAKPAAPLPPPTAPAPPASFNQQQDAVQREQQPAAPVPEYASLPNQERYSAQPESEALQLIQVTGLDEKSIDLLMQGLRSIQLPSGVKGDVVFELQVHRQRVRQVALDEQATTLLEQAVIDAIRRLLLTWKPPQPVTGLVRIHLRLQS